MEWSLLHYVMGCKFTVLTEMEEVDEIVSGVATVNNYYKNGRSLSICTLIDVSLEYLESNG